MSWRRLLTTYDKGEYDSERITIHSSEYNFFYENKVKVVLLVIYLLNYDSADSTFLILSMAFDFVLSMAFVKKIGILRFLQ